MSIVRDWVSKWANYRPNHVAVQDVVSQEAITYGQLDHDGRGLAYVMQHDWGLQKGDRLAILAENHVHFVSLFVAAQKTGIILVPLNWRLTGPEIDYLLGDAQPKVLLYQDVFETKLSQAPHHYPRLPIKRSWSQMIEIIGNMPSKSAPLPSVNVQGTDPIFILYTSGTTGFPKGVLYTHDMLLWNSLNTALRLDLTGQDRTLNVMPLFHTGGWNVLLTPLLHRGATTLLLSRFDASTVLRVLQDQAISIYMGVPTMLKMMAQEAAFSEADFHRLRYIIVGGEAMPIPLIETWQAKGIPIRQGYGMTEAGPNLTSLHHQDAIRKKGSIGKPNFYVETKIEGVDGQEIQAANSPGELLIKGPMVTPGYWQQPEATANTIINGWLHTGDMVVRDEEGYLYIVDRIKNMFISGGENVYPAEIERVVIRHQCVKEVAIVPIPHPKWGEVGRAFVSLNPGMTLGEEDLIAYCRQSLATFKVPKEVIFLEALPQNGTGKIDRKALKAFR